MGGVGRQEAELAMNDIWIHPENDHGYSAVLQYEDEWVSVSVGGANRCGQRYKVALVKVAGASFHVIGGDPEVAEFVAAADKREWAFRTFGAGYVQCPSCMAEGEAYQSYQRRNVELMRAHFAVLAERQGSGHGQVRG